jgi:hypothetical protein
VSPPSSLSTIHDVHATIGLRKSAELLRGPPTGGPPGPPTGGTPGRGVGPTRSSPLPPPAVAEGDVVGELTSLPPRALQSAAAGAKCKCSALPCLTPAHLTPARCLCSAAVNITTALEEFHEQTQRAASSLSKRGSSLSSDRMGAVVARAASSVAPSGTQHVAAAALGHRTWEVATASATAVPGAAGQVRPAPHTRAALAAFDPAICVWPLLRTAYVAPPLSSHQRQPTGLRFTARRGTLRMHLPACHPACSAYVRPSLAFPSCHVVLQNGSVKSAASQAKAAARRSSVRKTEDRGQQVRALLPPQGNK